MRLLIFMLSYFMGASVLLFDSAYSLTYLLLLFMYLALTDYLAPPFHRVLVIDPLLLAYSSVLLFSLMENRGEWVFVQYLLMAFFLFVYHHIRGKMVKEQYEKEEVNVHFYIKRLLLPLVYPIAFYFAIQFFVQQQLTPAFYWLFYFFVVLYFTKYIQTVFYLSYFAIMQVVIVTYLFQFMAGLLLGEKVMIYLFILATAIGRYYYKRTVGGEEHVPFVQTLRRKNVQKS